MTPSNVGRLGHFVFCVALLSSGCAWRMGNVEHYIGPVLFRYVGPPSGKAYVSQVIRYGISAEAGSEWGVSVGVSERIAVAPLPLPDGEARPPAPAPRWSTPLSLLRAPAANNWNLSVIYLRVEGLPRPHLVSRTIYGAEILVGSEVNALSVGAVWRTLFTPPENAFSMVHFDTSRPLEARAWVWFDAPERSVPISELLKEIER